MEKPAKPKALKVSFKIDDFHFKDLEEAASSASPFMAPMTDPTAYLKVPFAAMENLSDDIIQSATALQLRIWMEELYWDRCAHYTEEDGTNLSGDVLYTCVKCGHYTSYGEGFVGFPDYTSNLLLMINIINMHPEWYVVMERLEKNEGGRVTLGAEGIDSHVYHISTRENIPAALCVAILQAVISGEVEPRSSLPF
jgi:hypothetical protein